MAVSQNLLNRIRSALTSIGAAKELVQRLDNRVVSQGTPTAETGAATITVADILTGLVTVSHAGGATAALTLDTGTLMDAGRPSHLKTDEAIEWALINTSAAAADTVTITAATGHTIVGAPIIPSAHSTTGGLHGNGAIFRSRRTAANTWVTYRLAAWLMALAIGLASSNCLS